MLRVETKTPIAAPDVSGVDINEVEMGDGLLLTTGAQQCVIVAGHNHATGLGILGHFTELTPLGEPHNSGGQEAFEELVDGLPRLGPTDSLAVWTGGGSIYPDGDGNFYKDAAYDRQYIGDRMRRLVVEGRLLREALTISWQTEGQLDVQLDCPSGILTTYWRDI